MSPGFVIGFLLWLLPITFQILNLMIIPQQIEYQHQVSDCCKILVNLAQVNIIWNCSMDVALKLSSLWRIAVISKSV